MFPPTTHNFDGQASLRDPVVCPPSGPALKYSASLFALPARLVSVDKFKHSYAIPITRTERFTSI